MSDQSKTKAPGSGGYTLQVLVPIEVVTALDELAAKEGERTGYRVGRSAIVRKMIDRGLVESRRPR